MGAVCQPGGGSRNDAAAEPAANQEQRPASADEEQQKPGPDEPTDAAGEGGGMILVCKLEDFPEGTSRSVHYGTRSIAVFNRQGKFYALDNSCYHHGAALLNGPIEELGGKTCIVCPWHGYYITLAEGEGLYMGLSADFKTQEVKSKGRKQRPHRVVTQAGAVYVDPQLDGDFESDTYADGSGAASGAGGTIHSSRGGIERSGHVRGRGGRGRGRATRRRSSPKPLQADLRLVSRAAVCGSGAVVQYEFAVESADRAPLTVLPGQYVDVTVPVGSSGPPLRRQWTVVSRPGPQRFCIAVKRKEGGAVSPWMHDHLDVGEGGTLKVVGKGGDFGIMSTPLPVGCSSALLLAAGVGVTPMYAILRAAFDEQSRAVWQRYARGDVTSVDYALLYCERTESDVCFREELDAWSSTMDAGGSTLRVQYSLTRPGPDWKGPTGRLTADRVQELCPDWASRAVFVCGPGDFITSMTGGLVAAGMDPSQVFSEKFD